MSVKVDVLCMLVFMILLHNLSALCYSALKMFVPTLYFFLEVCHLDSDAVPIVMGQLV